MQCDLVEEESCRLTCNEADYECHCHHPLATEHVMRDDGKLGQLPLPYCKGSKKDKADYEDAEYISTGPCMRLSTC